MLLKIYLTILARFGTLIFSDKLKSYVVLSRVFGLIWYFVSKRLPMLEVVLNVNSFKNIEVNADIAQDSFINTWFYSIPNIE